MLVLLFVLLLIILPSLTWVSLILKLHVAHKSVVASLEEGEVSSAYFFRLIKKQSADCLVAALHCPDGTVVNSPPELVECFSQFYSDLFSAELVDFAAQDVLLSNVSAHLSPSSVMTVKASCLLRNVLLLFKAWLAGWPPYGVLS